MDASLRPFAENAIGEAALAWRFHVFDRVKVAFVPKSVISDPTVGQLGFAAWRLFDRDLEMSLVNPWNPPSFVMHAVRMGFTTMRPNPNPKPGYADACTRRH